MPYEDPDLIYDDAGTAEEGLAGVANRIAGWRASDGHVEAPMAEATAVAIATAATTMRDELRDRYADSFAVNLLRTPRGTRRAATASSTWTFDNALGARIPGGTEVVAAKPDGSTVVLVVAEDQDVIDGMTTWLGVELVALEPGLAGNGAATVVDVPDYAGDPSNPLVSVTLDAPSSDGQDDEDLDAFVSRVSERATQRLNVTPITPAQHAAAALDVPGIARAYALNRYDPTGSGNSNAPFHITLVLLQAGGQLPAGPKLAEVLAYFNEIERPYENVYHALAPATVDFRADVFATAKPGADPTALEALIEATVAAAFARETFDYDAAQPGRWSRPLTTSVTTYDVAAVVDDLPDLKRITNVDLYVSGSEVPQVSLPAPLTMPGTVTVNATVTT